MKLYVSILALVIAVAPAALARGASGQRGQEVTFKGYVVDRHCASGEGDRLVEHVKSMPKSCSLTRVCLGSGLGVVFDGRWYAFDSKGSARAAKLLEKSKTRKAVMVEVTGTVDGDELLVSSIAEIAER